MNKYKLKRYFYRFLGRDTFPSVDELRSYGVKIGKNTDLIRSSIDYLYPELLEIGDNVTITNATILTHDASTRKNIGYTKFAPVHIGSNVFIGFGAIVLPGVHIGDNVIIGAGSVVSKNISDNRVVAGTPPREIMSYEDYLEKIKGLMYGENVFNEIPMVISREVREKILEKRSYKDEDLKKILFFK